MSFIRDWVGMIYGSIGEVTRNIGSRYFLFLEIRSTKGGTIHNMPKVFVGGNALQ